MDVLLFLIFVIAIAWITSRIIGKKPRVRERHQIKYDSGAEISLEVSVDRRATKPEQRPFQPWLSKAVEAKKSGDMEKALELLDEAYKSVIDDEYVNYDPYIRLPAYLQLAGRNDEGWRVLNQFRIGQLPYRQMPQKDFISIHWQILIADKSRLFLEREKRYKEALTHKCSWIFLSMVNRRIIFEDAQERLNSRSWEQTPEYYDQSYFELDGTPESLEALIDEQKERAEIYLQNAQESLDKITKNAYSELLKTTKKTGKISESTTRQIEDLIAERALRMSTEIEATAFIGGLMREVEILICKDMP